MQPLRYLYGWLFAGLLMMGIALYLALTPDNRAITAAFFSDKAAHLLTFFVLMVWFCGIFRQRLTPAVALLLLCYGILIEYLQSMSPYRQAEFADVIADAGGILIGWALAVVGLHQWTARVERFLTGAED